MEFERLVEEHKDAVYRQMVRMCGNHDDAEDALAEALLRAHKASGSLRDQEAFRGWLAMIARRVCGRMKHKEQIIPLVSLTALEDEGAQIPGAPARIEEALAEKEVRSCVKKALADLEPIYRDVYLLRDVEGMSGEDAAEHLGISVAALKSRLHRARSMVREGIDLTLCA